MGFSVKSDYSVGDTLYTLYNNKIEECKVVGCELTNLHCSYISNDIMVSEYHIANGIRRKMCPDGYVLTSYLEIVHIPADCVDSIYFKTKTDLLNYLKYESDSNSRVQILD